MLKNLYLMSGTDAFTKGGLDNVALTENAVCLEQTGGRYVLYGCFTSPEIRFPAFRQLTVSWNAARWWRPRPGYWWTASGPAG